MLKLFLGTLIFIFLLLGCNSLKPKPDYKQLNFESFSIEVPSNWKKINTKHIDTYIGQIAIDSVDSLIYEFGLNASNLREYISIENAGVLMYYPILNYDVIKKSLDDSTEVYIDTPAIESYIGYTDITKVKKSETSIELIDGKKATVYTPLHSGIGTTGVYIDSLWVSESGI